MPIKIGTISVSSYLCTQSTREVKFYKKVKKPILENKHVLIIEDIIDKGKTLDTVYEYLDSLKPKTIDIITLADKQGCHPNFKFFFKVPNRFIVDYVFEIDDLYRQFDQVYTIKNN